MNVTVQNETDISNYNLISRLRSMSPDFVNIMREVLRNYARFWEVAFSRNNDAILKHSAILFQSSILSSIYVLESNIYNFHYETET